MRFPIYEFLYLLNRNLQETVDLLDQIQKSSRMTRQKFKAYQVEIECLRAEATQDVLEIMNSGELDIELTPVLDRPCQLSFLKLDKKLPRSLGYGARASDIYQGQKHPFKVGKDKG